MKDEEFWQFWKLVKSEGKLSGVYECIFCKQRLWNVSSGKLDYPLKLHIEVFHEKVLDYNPFPKKLKSPEGDKGDEKNES